MGCVISQQITIIANITRIDSLEDMNEDEANRIANGAMRAQHVPLTLQRVLGITSYSNACLSVCASTGNVAYASGSVVVIYVSTISLYIFFVLVDHHVQLIVFLMT